MGVYRGLQSYAVEAEDLKKTFKTSVGRALLRKQTVIVNAVDGLTLRIGRGQIHSLVGPNGAGKTTTIKILSTLLIPDSGRALVGGFDVVKEPEKVREIIGLVLAPDKGFYTRLTGLENLVYYGRLYGLSRGEAIRRARELLELVGLADEGKRLYEEYSLGMKAKLSIAKAMINDPSIIFFDEPTIGLDPLSARRVRQVIRGLSDAGQNHPADQPQHVGGREPKQQGLTDQGRQDCGRRLPRRLEGEAAAELSHRGGAPRLPRGGGHIPDTGRREGVSGNNLGDQPAKRGPS
jgi:ABC-type Na+ transport system ATPase subunit NatA